MSIYKTIATYALAALPFVAGAAISYNDNSQRIGNYGVSVGKITELHFPSVTTWEDTNGDGDFDKKTDTILTGRRALITVNRPFEEADKRLTDSLVARLE